MTGDAGENGISYYRYTVVNYEASGKSQSILSQITFKMYIGISSPQCLFVKTANTYYTLQWSLFSRF